MYFDGHLLTESGWVRGVWALAPVISPVDTIPRGAQVVRGWATPGLVDAHCHIGVGHGARVLSADEQRGQLRTELSAVVTSLARSAISEVLLARLRMPGILLRLRLKNWHVATAG